MTAIAGISRRRVYYTLGGIGSLALVVTFFVLLVGIQGWDGDVSSPLRIRAKGVDLMVQQAWHYLLPALVVFLASLASALVGGIWLVRNPAPRGEPF